MIIISLIGEQTIPNLLPILDQKPETAVLVYTDRTKGEAERIRRAPSAHCAWEPLLVAPYDIQGVAQALHGLGAQKEWQASDLLFNLTGGTKAMALAAYQVAQELNAPFFYFQSEGRKSLAHHFVFHKGQAQLTARREMPTLITIDGYLRLYIDDYHLRGVVKEPFEQAIGDALSHVVDELLLDVCLKGALEVDVVVRCGNQVGVIEAKTGGKALSKDGLVQINMAGSPDFLGTYTQRMLVIDQLWDNKSNLRELAQAQRITLIELPSYHATGQLSPEDTLKLQSEVCQALGKEIAHP